MNQVLGSTAGNALELREAIDFLTGTAREPRLLDVTLALAEQMLELAGLAPNQVVARRRAIATLDSGAAAERFARMVAGLGGPRNPLSPRFAGLRPAPVVIDVPSPQSGFITHMDTRAIGLAVVALGGGRVRASDSVDARVGLSVLRAIGARVERGEALVRLHARSRGEAEAARERLLAAITLGDDEPAATPVLLWSSAAG